MKNQISGLKSLQKIGEIIDSVAHKTQGNQQLLHLSSFLQFNYFFFFIDSFSLKKCGRKKVEELSSKYNRKGKQYQIFFCVFFLQKKALLEAHNN